MILWYVGVGNDPREDRYFSIPKQVSNPKIIAQHIDLSLKVKNSVMPIKIYVAGCSHDQT